MGVQAVVPDDGRGELQVLPGVKGLLLGVDPLRGDAHIDQLPPGAGALRHRLIAVVPSTGGDADRVRMGGQIRVGGLDAALQHHAGLPVIDLTAQQHHRARRVILRGTVSRGQAHDGQYRDGHRQHHADAGDEDGLQPFGKALEKAGEEATCRRQQQQRRRPEHADVVDADGQGHQEIDRSQQGEGAKDG